MKSTHTFKIELTREEKTKLDEAAEIFEEIQMYLVANRANGFTAFEEGLMIYDSFWKIYHICYNINTEQLIP